MSGQPDLTLDNDAALEVGLRMGIPRDKLERSLGVAFPSRVRPPKPAALTFPVCLTVEWSLLVSDNNKYGAPVARRSKSGVTRAQNFLTKEYREAKRVLKDRFRTRLGSGRATKDPLHIAYHFYWPDKRRHDATNHLKLLNDVLTGIVYADDAQLCRGSWQTSVDPDRPRCEIEIRSLPPAPPRGR